MKKQSVRKSKLIFIFSGILVLLAVAGFLLWQARNPASNIQITAQFEDESHINLSGAFRITGTGDSDIDVLASRLVIEPQMEFSLTPDSGALTLQTYRPLIAGKTIRIHLLDEKGREQKHWEFQTSTTFHVADVFPANDATNVAPNTSIEITFSHEDFDPEIMDEYFTVSPEISGQFMKRFNKLVFAYNNDRFSPNTTYTVTISGTLPLSDGRLLGEDYSFSFTTGKDANYEYTFNDSRKFTENFLPDENGTIRLRIGDAIKEQEITATIYQYANGTDYLGELRRYRDALVRRSYSDYRKSLDDWQIDTSELSKVMEFRSLAMSKGDSGDKCVVLPDTLAEGWYAAKLETVLPDGETISFYKLIQVSGLAIYYAQSQDMGRNAPNQLIAWINDTATGNPVQNAGISVTSSNYNVSGKTGNDGLAVLEGSIAFIDRYGEDDNIIWRRDNAEVYGLFTVESEGKPFYDLFGNLDYGGGYGYGIGDPTSPYYAYLFTDRPVYRPTDTVKVWGLIKSRQEGVPLPEDLGLTGLDGTDHRIPAIPAEDGTFQCEIKLEQCRTGWSRLELRDQDSNYSAYASLGLEIKSYVKPAYETNAQPDKVVYTDWDDNGADFSFHAAYYEGTPAQGYNAAMRSPEDYNNMPFPDVIFSTDADGDARITVHPDPASINQWQPQQVPYDIFSLDALDSPQIHGGSFHYIYRDTMLTSEMIAGANPSVTIFTNKVDVSRIKNESDLLIDENLKGIPLDADVTAEIHRVYFTKTPDGERYDAINKISETAYQYQQMDDIVDTLNLKTQNGQYKFENLPQNDEESSYYLELTVKDTRGLPVKETLYYGWALKEERWGSATDFKLLKTLPEDALTDPNTASYRLWDEAYFGDNETAAFDLVNDFLEPVNNPAGHMLYFVSQQRILDYGLVDGTQLSLPFREEYLPNYCLTGAYFDGKHIYAMRYTNMEFNPEKRELTIDIKPDKTDYDIGQSANVTLRVTEKVSGKPAVNATVVAAVVDEAVFAIREQTPEFLKQLYQRISFGYLHQYVSYDNHSTDGGGKGAGGPDAFAPRKDFKDTAAFTALKTDQNGEADFKVSLPDNLTSWRVTALALSDDWKAGDTKNRFSVSQDFFITPVVPMRILEGDDLVITVHSAGRKTSPEDLVEYTCQVDGAYEVRTFQGKAGEFSPVLMDRLPLGDYTVTISGKNGDNSDAVRVPFQVVKSGIDVFVSREISPQEIAEISSTTYPVTLGFYNKEYSLRADILNFLTNCRGIRTDQRVAQRYAQEQMLLGGMNLSRLDSAVLNDPFDNAFGERYLYRPLPYSEDSISFSAGMEMAIPDLYQGAVLSVDELNEVTDRTERAAGYLLYTRYNQDKKTQRIISGQLVDGSYNLQGKLYLTAALSRAGDNETAKERYASFLTGSVLFEQTDADGHRMLGVLRGGTVNGADTVTAFMTATQLALKDDAEAMARYLLANPPADEPAALEMIFFLRQFPIENGTKAQVSYAQNGAEQTMSLDADVQYRTFSREELKFINARAESGEVGVTAYYTAAFADAMTRENEGLILTKTIEAAGGGVLRQGELAKITLQLTAPATLSLPKHTYLHIEDYIPTGMRYEYMQAGDWYLSAHNDQRVSFNAALEKNGTLVYYARCVAEGRYIGESAFAGVDAGTVWGMSGRTQITIQP